jgi:hypothetical protein
MKLIAVVAPPLQPCPWSPESRRHVRPASEVPWMVSRAAAQSPVATKPRRASKNCTSSIANGGGDGVASRQDCPFVDTSSRESVPVKTTSATGLPPAPLVTVSPTRSETTVARTTRGEVSLKPGLTLPACVVQSWSEGSVTSRGPAFRDVT